MKLNMLSLNGVALAAALLVMPPVLDSVTGLSSGSSVFAKNGEGGGNGGGNGGGKGGGKGNSGSNSSSSDSSDGGQGHGKSQASSRSDKSDKFDKSDKSAKGEHKSLGNNHGAIASALGSLNAAHASLNARLNANPNSRVGLIAQYEQAVLAGRELSTQIADLDIQLADFRADLAELEFTDTAALEADIMTLTEEIGLLDPVADEQEIADKTLTLSGLTAELGEINEANAELEAEAIALEGEIATLEAEKLFAEDELDAAAVTEAESLAAAANKYDSADDVPDEVVAELQSLLGIGL